MSNWDQDALQKDFSSRLGFEEDPFDLGLRNPLNAEPLTVMDHNDLWGVESRIFSLCFQSVREQAGPFKIFGSM